MRVYTIPVPVHLQPVTQGFIWPPGCEDFGVEQDFLQWLHRSGMATNDPARADWHYLPVFWNRYWWQHQEDHDGKRLNDAIAPLLLDRDRTFIVCEYDPLEANPQLDLADITVFTASRRADNRAIDIPLLLKAHRLFPNVEKRWLAAFIGNYETDGIRLDMVAELQGRDDCYVPRAVVGIDEFVRTLQSAWVALAPRGVGAQSFRFYEAMQAGTVPLYISDLDCRPFRDWIDWSSCSLYRQDTADLSAFLDSLDTSDLAEMGMNAHRVWHGELCYGRWCKYVIQELRKLR